MFKNNNANAKRRVSFLLPGGDYLNVPQLMTSLQPRAATCTDYKIPLVGKTVLLQPNLLGTNLGMYI